MGIIKNEKIGIHKDATVLTFGTGDIAVSDGRFEDDNSLVTVCFSQDIEKPISEWNPPGDNIEHTTNDLNNIVLFIFNKTESIDVVIKKLNAAKEKLIKKLKNHE